jgi:hypothetical protein
MTYSFKLPILSSWKTTLQAFGTTIKKKRFLLDTDFQWVDFDPRFAWAGMTVSAVTVNECRYLKIGKICWIRIYAAATFAAPLGTLFVAYFPPELTLTSISGGASWGVLLPPAAAAEILYTVATGGNPALLVFQRAGGAAFAAGAHNISYQGMFILE